MLSSSLPHSSTRSYAGANAAPIIIVTTFKPVRHERRAYFMPANAQPWIARLMKMETLIIRFKSHCVYCGKMVAADKPQPHPDAPSRDHFIPLSRGGSRGAKNTVLACYDCNQKKGNMDPRQILFTWLWLNPASFHAAVKRFDAINDANASIH